MGYPQHLNVVVLAASESGYHGIRKLEGLRKPGISPRYTLSTISPPVNTKLKAFAEVDQATVGFWIALDVPSEAMCRSVVTRLRTDPTYTRGFYDQFLPDPVVRASGMKELQDVVDDVWDAFCATS